MIPAAERRRIISDAVHAWWDRAESERGDFGYSTDAGEIVRAVVEALEAEER